MERIITTPNFPDNYPNDVDMTWLIKYPPGERIKINFTEFKLEKRLKSDYLTISDGDFTNPYTETNEKVFQSDKHYNIHQGCAFFSPEMICHSSFNTPPPSPQVWVGLGGDVVVMY